MIKYPFATSTHAVNSLIKKYNTTSITQPLKRPNIRDRACKICQIDE